MSNRSVAVVVAHPDDEILGCGGTIARHAAEGDTVHVAIVAEGVTSRQSDTAQTTTSQLRFTATEAAKLLGTEAPLFFSLPDQRLDTVPLLDIVQLIESFFDKVRPEIAYTHFGGDLNQDHGIVHRAVLTASRPVPGQSVNSIYAFETPSSTEWSAAQREIPFSPNRYVDISNHLEKKMAALELYASEMRPSPHPRSMENIAALATTRGAEVSFNAAEAFMVVRDRVAE